MHVTTTSLESARKDLQLHTEEINYLNEFLDNLKQCSRERRLEFHGVPENSYASTEEVALEVQVINNDIEILHKLWCRNAGQQRQNY